MMLSELSNNVVAAMFLSSLILLTHGQQGDENQNQEADRSRDLQPKFPKGVGMMVLKELPFNKLFPRLIDEIKQERLIEKQEEKAFPSYRRDPTLEALLTKRHSYFTRRVGMMSSPYSVKPTPISVSKLLTTDKLTQRRKRAKMLINNLAALFSDLRSGQQKGSLIMPSLRIG